MRLLLRLRPILEHRHFPLVLALLAVLLASPSMTVGWIFDDYSQRMAALDPAEEMPPGLDRLNMFVMSKGNPETIQYFRDQGFAPWWTPENFKLGFWRPLASAHHLLQYRLWPDSPMPMHGVSLAWLAAATYLAALFFRRFIDVPWIAGLAGLLYALQPGHALTAGWIANQNALLSLTLGLGSVLTHDRWRVGGWRPGAVLSPVLLLLAVLCGESGTSAGAVLLAYAIFKDPVRMHPRALFFILPHFLVGLAWAIVYKLGGYAMDGTDFYIDPAGEPARFAWAVVERVPVLVASVWFLLPSTFLSFVSADGQWIVAVVCAVVVLLMLLAMRGLFRTQFSSRFFLMALLLALLPICATLPNDRNLMWVGLPGLGLLAQWIGSVVLRAEDAAGGESASRFTRGAAVALLFVHFTLGPLASLGNSRSFASFDHVAKGAYANVMQDPAVRNQMVVIVNPPAPFMASGLVGYRKAIGQPVPGSFRMLAAGVYPLKLTRIGERSVALRAEGGGILQPVGTWDVPGQPRDPFFNVNNLSLIMDRVFRAENRPFSVGETSRSAGMTSEVREVSSRGGVNEVHFTFDVPLEDESLLWVKWEGGTYVEFDPPALGESVDLAPVYFMELMTM